MQPMKVDVLIALFAYSGNGGIPGTIPELAVWLAETTPKLKTDPRVGRVAVKIFCDTPITMTRNAAIEVAQVGKFDIVLMLDSDNQPDPYVGIDPNATPFWDTAFTFAYDRLMLGKPTTIAAPYCGPPPHPIHPGEGEVPYLFQWINAASDEPEPGLRLHRLNRNEAAIMRGIHPVAALPTGVCLFTTNCFDALVHPYFKYEFNAAHSKKESTEDVVVTRDISLAWQAKLGEDVVFAACDSWALHHKVKLVGRPTLLPTQLVAESLKQIVLANHKPDETLQQLDYGIPPELRSQVPAPAAPASSPVSALPGVLQRTHLVFGTPVVTPGAQVPQEDLDVISTQVQCVQLSRPNPLRIVEVDAHYGEVTHAIWHALGKVNRQNGSQFFSICSEDMPNQWLMHNLRPLVSSDAVKLIHANPIDVAEDQPESQELDLVVLGYEDYETNLTTIAAWWRHLRHDGLMLGRRADEAEVFQAVSDFANQVGAPVRMAGSVWSLSKKEASREPGTAAEPVSDESGEPAVAGSSDGTSGY